MPNVHVVAFPAGMASSLAITLDVLETANQVSRDGGRPAPFEVTRVRANAAAPPPLGRGGLLILPGLGVRSETELATRLASRPVARAGQMAANALANGACVAASCASTFVLAQAGLLSGRRATTTWWLAPAFRRLNADVDLVVDQIVVPDWPVATAGAAMAQMELMLAVVAKFASRGLSEACARYLLLGQRRSQTPYMAVAFLAGQDERIARAETWVRENIARNFSMDELAAAVNMTPRTFARRLLSVCGLSPVRFAQRIRVETAERLLETTRLSIEAVALRVGYAEPSTLRRLIRREARRSPAELRRAV